MVDRSRPDFRYNDCGVLNVCFTPSQISAEDRVEGSVMGEHSSGGNNDPQLDEQVWQRWVRKNEAKDKVSFARRKTLLAVVLILGIAAFALWRVAG